MATLQAKIVSTMRTFDLKTTTSFVVANMIGTGVFTSLGYQLMGIQSTFVIMMLWLVGGLAAFTGALSYVALAQHLPRSGGEYHFISVIYGEMAGFVTGFITVTIGFAAPIAATAIAFGIYTQSILPIPPILLAALSVVSISAIHIYDARKGGNFHFLSTLLKILLVILFILTAFILGGETTNISLLPQNNDLHLLGSSAFAVSLVYVVYSYTGWNAAVYVLDEVENPKRNIPLALLLGTGMVMVLYLLLNYAFLYVSPIEQLSGKLEVGQIAATSVLGERGGIWMAGLIAIGLIATLSSMIVTGSRVLKVMAEDYEQLHFLRRTNEKNAPYVALLLQGALALLFVFTATFETVITYTGFLFGLFNAITVFGLFVLKWRNQLTQLPFGKWFFPAVPLLFIAINAWMVIYVVVSKPIPSLMGLSTVLFGGIIYLLIRKRRF